jgi:biotin transporter BioY
MLKTVAFIAGKSENPADQKKFICFFIDNLIANISLYALSWPKLNFGCYLIFEIIFKALKLPF